MKSYCLDSKRVEWLDYVVFNNLKQYIELRQKEEQKNRFPIVGWNILAAAFSGLVGYKYIADNEWFQGVLLFFSLYAVILVVFSPFFEKLIKWGQHILIVNRGTYNLKLSQEKLALKLNHIRKHLSNNLLVCYSVVEELGRADCEWRNDLYFLEVAFFTREIAENLNDFSTNQKNAIKNNIVDIEELEIYLDALKKLYRFTLKEVESKKSVSDYTKGVLNSLEAEIERIDFSPIN